MRFLRAAIARLANFREVGLAYRFANSNPKK
jgi:hypothetical protein